MPLATAASAYDHSSQGGGSTKSSWFCPRPKADAYESATTKQCCSRSLVIKLVVVLVIIIAAVIGLVFALAPPGGPQKWFLHTPPPGLSEAQRWDNGGRGGLRLTVLNAVDGNYQTLFYEWVQKWDNGTPDALTLTTEKVTYDSACAPVDGVLKVCNGDYGNTGWRGIDLSTMYQGYIINSVAKMNDYYLSSEGSSWKEYTMCHEMGHGFGLPHSEENYYDSNRGDCLDLTLNTDGAIQPGSFNFNFLAELYGTVDGKVNATKITNSTTSGTATYGGSSRRTLERKSQRGALRSLEGMMPLSAHRALVKAKYSKASKEFETRNLCHSLSGDKLGCAIDLGHGYTLDARVFPVDP